MEIWIAKGHRKDLRKAYPFIRDFAVIDIGEIAVSLGYSNSISLDDHQSFVLSAEIQKRLIAINSSKRFFRILYLVEEVKETMPQDLLNFSIETSLSYDKIYLLRKGGFELQLSLSDFSSQ